MEDLLTDFLSETTENLADLDIRLVRLEREPDDKDTLGAIFRHVHTIKGTCGFMGLSRLERLAHAAENVLGQHRDGTLPVTPGSITLILRAMDGVRDIVRSLQETGMEPEGDDAALIADLAAATAGGGATSPTPEGNHANADDEGGGPHGRNGTTHGGNTAADDDLWDSIPGPVEADASATPVQDAPAPVPGAAPASAAAATQGPRKQDAPEPAAQTIRVNVDVLEGLMTLVSELVLTRNQILQLARTQDNDAFAGPLQRLSHITSDLQEGVMKTRMQPIGNAWGNLPRLVRDLAADLGKKIELVMVGADTELDRQVLELIKDPLTHMVRNSADHGLETPEARRAAGKPEQGKVRLNAYHEGGHIVIEVGDDGRGLPVDRIKAKIIANGLATEADLASMSDQQVRLYIFKAGFSTAAAVTSVSGRGVGMDVVKTNVERISGTIDVTSEKGKGTLFTVKIPLTLAIVSALIVEVGGDRFAIPQISVVELVRARTPGSRTADGDRAASGPVIEQINETPVLRLRDHLLPLVGLGGLLRIDGDGGANPAEGLYIVVVQVGSNKFGLIVDKVFDTEEIVVKPVAPILRHITLFSGNTILGDGSVIMILDPNGIARATGIGGGHSADVGASDAAQSDAETSERKIALLLFKAGDGNAKAVPLSLVSRLESIPHDSIEHPGGQPMTQYRGKLMPLVPMSDDAGRRAKGPTQPILVFADGERVMGLLVDEIVDVVEEAMRIELPSDHAGFLGTAVVAGKATDILDTGHWLQRAFKDWFGKAARKDAPQRRILVVEDSAFFRSLIIPALSAQGHQVTAVENPLAALAMRQSGRMFDLILSDIEMPEMDGIAFVKDVRAGGAWRNLPMIALSGQNAPKDVEKGRTAGFDGYISKFDKAVLIEAVTEALATHRGTETLEATS